MNTSMFLNNTSCSYYFSPLDSREMMYVNFFGPSNATVSRGSMANGSFSSTLTWAANYGCYEGCDLQGKDYLSYFSLFVPVWIVGSIVVRPANYLEGQPAPHWSNN